MLHSNPIYFFYFEIDKSKKGCFRLLSRKSTRCGVSRQTYLSKIPDVGQSTYHMDAMIPFETVRHRSFKFKLRN